MSSLDTSAGSNGTPAGSNGTQLDVKPSGRKSGPVEFRSPGEIAAEKKRGRIGLALVLPGFIFLLLFFAAPVLVLLAMSLYAKPPGAEIGEFVPALQFSNYAEVFSLYWEPLIRSFAFAAVATVLALLIGYPMAYLVAVRLRQHRLLAGILLVLLIAPFFSSFILRTQAWKQILADEGPVVSVLRAVAILPEDGRLTASVVAVIAGLTYNFLPFMTLPIYASLERLDTRMLEASGDLYASPFTTFRKVTLPLSMPGVFAGTLLTFIPASGDYVNAAILGNNRDTTMIGQVIDSRFFRVVDYPAASALSAILMIAILILVMIYIRRFGTKDLF
ncbi:spermidine/putrescine transport system permease protein [Neomicrococcus aestuarii]|uniref:Spermidine/putrescine transport system permease protein n=1 Tax=Neomicrococcus aestuarii TaxID=556325 RepID=A0A7W8WZD4_9MICC|nr:ABC transporter permease [Neomicrococcus aestuarii]MBB5513246.1 spermidine/putrescine transport system permease protein [Neomicrococcus aestuarii]